MDLDWDDCDGEEDGDLDEDDADDHGPANADDGDDDGGDCDDDGDVDDDDDEDACEDLHSRPFSHFPRILRVTKFPLSLGAGLYEASTDVKSRRCLHACLTISYLNLFPDDRGGAKLEL